MATFFKWHFQHKASICWKHFSSCSQEFDEDVSFGEAPILEMPNSDNEDQENIEKNENSKFSINDDEDIDVNDI